MKKHLTMKRLVMLAAAALLSAMSLINAQGRVLEFENPKMTVYLPANPAKSGRALIACPGGGYSHLAKDHEGHHWAHFYNDLGLAYAVLEYRMPKGEREIPLGDVERAFKLMTDSAAVWKINPEDIGIMGSSAGGHLAATASTHQRGAMKPSFQVLFYPVASLDSTITHKGTRHGFLGGNPEESLVREFSAENSVGSGTPRAFIALSADDTVVVPENSLRFFSALCRNGIPAAMFIYPTGGHGWGYRTDFKYHDNVLAELKAWLESF